MSNRASGDDFIGDLYETALDDDLWPQFARVLANATGAPTSAVWVVDGQSIRDLSVTEDGLETDIPYRRYFWKLDPWQRVILQLPTERVWLGAEVISERRLVETEFYNDFAKSFGLFRPMAATIRLAPGVFATASLERPGSKTLFEEHDKIALENLVPHIQRALQLRLRHQESGLRSAKTTAALDAFAFGVVICDRTGKIAFANKAAGALSAERAGIALGKNGVTTYSPNEAQRLSAAIGDAGRGIGGAIRLTGDEGRLLLVLLSSLPSGMRHEHDEHNVMLVLRRVDDGPRFSADALATLFRLSPTQAALCVALLEGRSLKDIAADRGVKLTTLRSHAQEAMLRVGAKSLRDLVRLIGNLPPV